MNYQAASSVATARLGADDKFLAGGQSLLGAIKLGLAAPAGLVDVRRLPELQGITVDAKTVRIGAATTHATVAASADVRRALPALADLAGRIGDRQVRNVGTLGGSLANNDPAACYPAAVLGLGATVHTSSRTIAADDFFLGLFTTALQDGELITAVSFPIPKAAAWQKFKQPASRFSLVGVFVARLDSGVRVAVTGAGPGVFRCSELETALGRDWSAAAARSIKVSADGLNSDLHGTAAYRAALIPELAARAIAAA
ncbi:carbon monoxide dehydrogenase [Pelomonas sp. Root1217]|uniref:FAD binding domain-containing protein n=1 Tax=Pelomonas sp. Root1217 TaxID=1736430 RepID=UPI00070ED2A8|nr:FAD binding domain-containing protein [Pelomonas sp. Root1217]KQV50462.1 carbon monoxide dehydrogenase [Pelomonas sp. Root1217]